jgi:hypothetical protein
MHKKSNLLAMVESMLGRKLEKEEAKDFNILTLLNQPYFATCIESEDGKYTNIQSIVKLPKSMVCPDQITPTQEILQEDWEKEIDSLPEYIANKIKSSNEYSLAQ